MSPQMPQQPFTIRRKLGNKVVEVCGKCHHPMPQPFSFQAADNMIYKKYACENCGWVIRIDGPFRSHIEANPRPFK